MRYEIASTAPMYELIGVAKDFQAKDKVVHALHDVDLVIPQGSLVSIQGPTGGGKSTLLQLLGGLDVPTSGTLRFAGTEISDTSESGLARLRAEHVGFVFQHFNLLPTLTAAENVEAALVPLAMSADERKQRVAETLAAVGLTDRANHLPGELSGGQQQRVAIARAIVKNPDVILADEPTGNLDEGTRDEIMGLLELLWKERHLVLVVVTHDSTIAKRAQLQLTIKDGAVSTRS